MKKSVIARPGICETCDGSGKCNAKMAVSASTVLNALEVAKKITPYVQV